MIHRTLRFWSASHLLTSRCFVSRKHFAADNNSLVDILKHSGVIKSASVEAVMRAIDRKHFVPSSRIDFAYEDTPQPIGYNATISAPHMHATALVINCFTPVGTLAGCLDSERKSA